MFSFSKETTMGISRIGREKSEPTEAGRVDVEVESREDSARSGVRMAPSLSARVEAALAASERLEAALEASSKTEAALADVFRTTKFLTATVTAVREANAAVTRELESLSETVSPDDAHESAFGGRIQRMERVLHDAGHDAERERLIAEHDQFIAMLLADHERELEALRRRFAEIQSSKDSAPRAASEEANLPSK
jgi:hypothetical protein